ncbi:MAG TPA: alanine dehydrogenase [Nitrospirota bacterium]
MVIGVPKEIKDQEFRVGMVPAGVMELTHLGHQVYVEKGAGLGSGITDTEFLDAGAKIAPSAKVVYGKADMVIKVKEPLHAEFPLLRDGQVLFTFLHLAAEKALTIELLARNVTSIGYETIQREDGSLPLLMPMSQVAGRLAVQVGANFLQENKGGRGVLLSGVPGVEAAKVVIIGAGTVGANAAKIAHGMGADTTVIDISVDRLDRMDDLFQGKIRTLVSSRHIVEEYVGGADLLIGAVLVPGAMAPKLVGRGLVSRMKKGAVIVDVAIDQGGCVETSRPTSHSDPVYMVDGVVHYCVTNMPGAVPRTSTFALTNVTLPYAVRIAQVGPVDAMKSDPALMKGLNTYRGRLTNHAVARALRIKYEEAGF